MSLNKASKSQSKPYRERHQPHLREHLGLLEKKKDYKLRAKDYNDKKEVLKHLRKKALNKNPDEFYFHMANAKLVDGAVHKDLVSKKAQRGDKNVDQIRLMQTQDYKYVSMRRLMEQKKIEKLKSTLHLLDSPSDGSDNGPRNTHTLFVDNDVDKTNLDLASRLDTVPEMLGRACNRPRLECLRNAQEDNSSIVDYVIKRKQSKAYKQLGQRIAREKQLAVAESKMKVRRELADKRNQADKVIRAETSESAPLIKWKVERKR